MWKVEIIDDYSPGWTLVLKNSSKYRYKGTPVVISMNDFYGNKTAQLMGISHKIFIDTLLTKYNALLYEGTIVYFRKVEDFQECLEWIESGILINTLIDE